VPSQHPEHFRAGALDNGYTGQQCRPQVKRENRPCRGWEVLVFCGNDIVEIGNDGTEHPVAPKLMLARQGPDHSPHQEKPCDFGRRSPGSDATFGFIIEQLFATKSCTVVLPEGGGEFAPTGIPELVSTQRASDAPSEQLASQDWRSVTRATVRAVLRWHRGEKPMR
jgi:hypothetical protein